MRGLAFTIALFAAALASAHARADARDDAKREFTDGQAADRQKDWKGAIEHYLRAYDLVPHPFALYNIAADYEQLGKLREAAHYYQLYVDAPESTDREKVRRQIVSLHDRPAKLDVTSDPDGAKIAIDGESVGTTPYTGRLKGGSHRIVVEREDKHDAKQVTVEFGEPIALAFDLGGRGGSLALNGYPPGAHVAIDGTDAGTMPLTVPLAAGEHKVEITQQGYAKFEQTATVSAGQVTVLRPRLNRENENVDANGNPIHLHYEFGFGGGADVRGHGAYGALEFGIRVTQYEAALTVGKIDGLTSVELQIRYGLTKGRVAPVVGAGYSYLGSGSGYEAFAGLRADLIDTPAFGLSFLGSISARYTSGPKTDPMSGAPIGPTGYFPASLVLQLYYLPSRH